MEHKDPKDGSSTEVEFAVSHAAILAFSYGTALVDNATLNMEEKFSEGIVSRMGNTELKRGIKSSYHID
jgi:hypothetical protein